MPQFVALSHQLLVYLDLRRILAKFYDLLLEFRHFTGFRIDLTFERGDPIILVADMGLKYRDLAIFIASLDLERLYFVMLIADLGLQFH